MGVLPETIVTDNNSGKQVQLRPVSPKEAGSLFPYPADALEFLPSSTQDCLSSKEAGAAYIERQNNDPCVAAAGVFIADGELAGVTSWAEMPRGLMRNSIGYGIYLSARRGEGFGRLVTAGMVALGVSEEALWDDSHELPLRPAALFTYIHPANKPSLKICESSGLVNTGKRDEWGFQIHALMHPADAGKYFRYNNLWLFGDELRSASAEKVGELAGRYSITTGGRELDWEEILAPRITSQFGSIARKIYGR